MHDCLTLFDKLHFLRFIAIKQQVDSEKVAKELKMDVKAASIRLLRYHRQGLLRRVQVNPKGKRVYIPSQRGRERLIFLARNRNR